MILVTGGAGFIGSNLVAEIAARGLGPVVVCDRFGTGEKWRNLAGAAVADLVAPERPAGLAGCARRGEPRCVLHLGASSSTTERDVDFILGTTSRVAGTLALVRRQRRPFHLRLVRRGLRRRRRRFRRRHRSAAMARLALERVRLVQAVVRQGGGPADGGRRGAAAMGRHPLFQRLRSERGPQGRPAVGGIQTARARSPRSDAPACSGPIIPTIPTADRCGTSSGSAIAPR